MARCYAEDTRGATYMAGTVSHRIERGALFTKSFGDGWKINFITHNMDALLAKLLMDKLPLKASVNVGNRTLMSLNPCLATCVGKRTLLNIWRRDGQNAFHISGQDSNMGLRYGHKSFVDIPVDVLIYLDGLGVIAIGVPTAEQIASADTTEPSNKPFRSKPVQDYLSMVQSS
jgi:hypothetical protein